MTPAAPTTFDTALLWLIAGWTSVAIGALLLLWALFRDRSRGRRRCPKCWYDMTGVPSLKCPECGREAKRERRLFKTRRRYGFAIIAAIFLLVGTISTCVPVAIERGVLDAIPMFALRPLLWLQRANAKALYESHPQLPGPWNTLDRWTKAREGWRQLLLASELNRRLASAEFVATRYQDLQDLTELNYNARPAFATVHRLLDEGDSSVPGAAMLLTQSGVEDFTDQLTHLLARNPPAANQHEVVMALVSDWALNSDIHPAFTVEVIDRWNDFTKREAFQLCARQAEGQDGFARQLLTLVIEHGDSETRLAALTAMTLHSGRYRSQQWAQHTVEQAWPRLSDEEREVVIAILTRSDDLQEIWGPRLLAVCELPGTASRSACHGIINRTLRHESNAPERFRIWMAELDATHPLPNGRPRRTMAWLIDQGLSISSDGASPCISLVRTVLQPDEQLRVLLRMSRDSRDLTVSRQALAAIGASLGPEGSAQLAREWMYFERSEWLRATLLDSVVKPHASRVDLMQPIILDALQDPSVPVLLNACLAAGEMGTPDTEVLMRLESLSKHEDAAVTRVAAAALEKLRNPPRQTDSPP